MPKLGIFIFFRGLPDLPERASENVDVLLAALKAAAMQGWFGIFSSMGQALS